MNKDAIIQATAHIVSKIISEKDGPLEDLLRLAMKEARSLKLKTPLQQGQDVVDGELVSFWEQSDEPEMTEDERFRAAVTAVAHVVTSDTRKRIKDELRLLGAIAAKKRGKPFDIRSVPNLEKPIDLMAYWKESEGGESKT